MRRLLVTMPLLLAVVMAACGDANGDNGIATAGDDPTTGTEASPSPRAGDLSAEDEYEMLLDFAACMREHGIDMEDPVLGEGLRLQIDGDQAEADAAMAECRHLLPFGGEPPEPDPEERERMLVYAQCMRDNGVESFPDPRPGEGISIGPEQAEDPDFDAAEQTCNEEVFGEQPETNTTGRRQG